MKYYRWGLLVVAIGLLIYATINMFNDPTTDFRNPRTYLVQIALIVIIPMIVYRLRIDKQSQKK
jgi:hypothetical protein